MVEVTWTDNAIRDLNDIADYISKDSVRYAEMTVEQLFGSVDILEQYPKAGAVVNELGIDTLRQLVRGNYRIVYQIVNERRIDILTVHHCARLISNSSAFKND